MINPNTFQLVVGVSNAQKIGQESRRSTPFAAYDALSPDEPGQALQFVKRLLHLASPFTKSDQSVRIQATYSRATDRHPASLFE